MNKSSRKILGVVLSVCLAGCGRLEMSNDTKRTPPATEPSAAGPETPAEPTPEAGAVPAEPAPAAPSVIAYNPALDTEMLESTLSRVTLSVQSSNYAQVGPDLTTISTVLGYIESHLPTVVISLGTHRIQTLIDEGAMEGAESAAQQLAAEVQSIASLMLGSDVGSVLAEVQSALASGNATGAKQSLGKMQVSGSATSDPFSTIQAMRDHLSGAMLAAKTQPPKGKVVQAELSDVKDLLGQLKTALGVGDTSQSAVTPSAGQPAPAPSPSAKQPTPSGGKPPAGKTALPPPARSSAPTAGSRGGTNL